MSQQGHGPDLRGVVLVAAVVAVIACVIGNAKGQKDGCEAEGRQIRGLECVEGGK